MEQIKIPEQLYPYFEKAGYSLKYEPGQTIYMQGDVAQSLYFIKEGRVRAFCTTKSGREMTFEIVGRGKIIGETSFLGHGIYPVCVEAVNQVELLVCNLNQLYDFMEESKELMKVMMQLLSRTCNHLVEQLRRVTLYDRYQKIASFLLYETEMPDSDKDVTKDSIPYTQEELALILGMNRVTVSKVLSEWKKSGIISSSYKKIRIQDRNYLKELLKPSVGAAES